MAMQIITKDIDAGGVLAQNLITEDFYVGGVRGVKLSAALQGPVAGLDGPDGCILHERVGEKVTLKIMVEGHEDFGELKYVRRTRQNVQVPRSTLTKRVAEVVDKFIKREEALAVQNGRWIFGEGPGRIGLDQIYLLQLRQVSQGTYRPVLGIEMPTHNFTVPPTPTSTPVQGDIFYIDAWANQQLTSELHAKLDQLIHDYYVYEAQTNGWA